MALGDSGPIRIVENLLVLSIRRALHDKNGYGRYLQVAPMVTNVLASTLYSPVLYVELQSVGLFRAYERL